MWLSAHTIKFGSAKISTETDLKSVKDGNLKLGIRSEYVQLTKSAGKNTVQANIESVDELGKS